MMFLMLYRLLVFACKRSSFHAACCLLLLMLMLIQLQERLCYFARSFSLSFSFTLFFFLCVKTDICFSTFIFICYFAARIKRYYVILGVECNANRNHLKISLTSNTKWNFFVFFFLLLRVICCVVCFGRWFLYLFPSIYLVFDFFLWLCAAIFFSFIEWMFLCWLYFLFNVSPVFYIFFSSLFFLC